MSAGRVILLHGTSSSGKTTIARAVQRRSDEPWLRLRIDVFWSAVHERWFEHGERAAEGFLWTETSRIVPGHRRPANRGGDASCRWRGRALGCGRDRRRRQETGG
jgi:chloramphenicol 3-O phosphotransferase